MGGALRYVLGLGVGVFSVATAVFLAWVASTDTSPMSWVTPYAFITVMAWWMALTMGVSAAVTISGRTSAGMLTGLVAVPGYVLSMALTWDPVGGMAAFGEVSSWVIAVVTLVVPWAFGLAFGMSVLDHRKPVGGVRP
jgi:hypothetical protein